MAIRYLFILVLTVPLYAQAETVQPGYLPPTSVVPIEEMLKMVIGLLIVLAIIGAITWILKRFVLHPTTASNAIKIIASVSVGQRERIILIEVENTRLVVGVAPGHINTLHCIDKPATQLPKDILPDSDPSNFLKQLNQSR